MIDIPEPSDSQKFFKLARAIDSIRALREEIANGQYSFPEGLQRKVEDLLDISSLSTVLDRAMEDARENLQTARQLAVDYDLAELGDRLRQILEKKSC